MMRINEGIGLIANPLGRRWLRRTIRQRIYSRRIGIGLLRDLHGAAFTAFRSPVPTTIRRLQPDDDLSLLDDAPDLDPRLAQLRADQRWLLDGGDLPTPWVAIDPDGKVCFMTYMFTSKDNDAMQARWGDMLPVLQSDESMIEGIYTAEKYRGLGIMVDAGTRVVEEAREGAKWGMGFIWEYNPASIKAGMKGGWFPFAKREERWLLFRRRVQFLPLTEDEGMTPELQPAAAAFLQRQASR
jgi:GNAT superfamily N-acetyltransferase